MEIIMTRFALFLSLVLILAHTTSAEEVVSANTVIREMNLARQNPALYATNLEELRASYNGRFLVLPGRTKIVTKEGLHAVDDAIRFLRTTQPQQALQVSEGMSRAAADHCAEQAGGSLGHGGRGFSNPGGRMKRYGTWGGGWGENIAYGKTSARDIVMALIIDDGLPARKHRKNIFNPNFNYAGAGYGPHARFGSVCSIDFAGLYTERGRTVAQGF
jgi:uncharacterized protein YkwD